MQLFNTGIVALTAQEALDKAIAIFKIAYGDSVNTDPSSPNGLLIQQIANAFIEYDANMIKVMYTMNPNIASGYALDSIIANLGIERTPATPSTASCVITGLNGTTIPEGSQIKSTNGDLFETTLTVTIGLSGTITIAVRSVVAGEILVNPNTLNIIVTNINGWDTVNNPTAGILGAKAQNDVEVRNNRLSNLAFSSANSLDSAIAGASSLAGVKSWYVTQNITNLPQIIDDITIDPISILTVLDGGVNSEIADMLYKRTSIGTSGNTSFTVTIPNTVETQTMYWQTAVVYDLKLTISLQSGYSYSNTLAGDIANIMNTQYNFNRIGRQILASQILTLLNNNGITPILALTFDVGTIITDQTNYKMKITDALNKIFLATNITFISI